MLNFFKTINKYIHIKALAIAIPLIIFSIAFTTLCAKFISYSFVEKKFNELTGLKIEFIQPKTNFDISFNLTSKAKAIEIYNQNKTVKFISLENPTLTFKPIGFLFNRAYLKNINADNINIVIKRDNKGNIDLLDSINKNFHQKLNKNTTLTRLNSNIKNIDIIFTDNYNTASQTRLNSKDFAINYSKRKKYLRIKQTGSIKTTTKNNTQIANLYTEITSNNLSKKENLKLNIDFNNINLLIFSDVAKKYISKNINKVYGKADLKINTENSIHILKAHIANPTFELDNNKIISPYKNGINASSSITFSKNIFYLSNLIIKAKELELNTNVEIANISSKKPTIKLQSEIINTQINNLIPFIPDNAIFYRPTGIPTLKKSNFYGLANGKINLELFPLNMVGNLKIENIHIPNYPKPYKQNDVNIRFLGDKVKTYTRIYTPDNEYVLVDGISNLDNSLWGKYNIKSTSKIDLAFARLYLVPIQQIIGFNIGPVPIMDLSGYGNININTQGTIDDAQIFGSFNAYNATAKIQGLDAKLTNGSCKLIFENKDIIFKEIKGLLDDSEFILTGKGNTKGEIKLNTKLSNAQTSKIIKIFNNSIISKPYAKLTKDIKPTKGTIEANINLEGKITNYEDPTFLETLTPSGKIILKNNEMQLKNFLKLNNLEGIIEFGILQNTKLHFNINNSPFTFEVSSKDSINKISKGNDFNIVSNISSNKISFADITKELTCIKTLNKTQIQILNQLSQLDFYTKLSLHSKGTISLKNTNLKNFKHNGYLIGLNDSNIEDIKFNSGIIKFNNDKAIFDNIDINVKKGKIKANGNIYNINTNKPLGDLNIILKNIDIEKLNELNSRFKIKKININNGKILFKNQDIKLSSISLNYEQTPLFFNATLKNIYDTRSLEANFSTIINEYSADNIINPHLISPLKVTGELPIKGYFKGNSENYELDFNSILPKNSDISFSGANLGDTNHKREISGKINVSQNIAKIQNLKLIKYIANQNKKINPLTALKINGQIIQKNNLISYDNLKIETNSPINVRILNLIFKKSLLKKGNFDCNITLNGDLKLPRINGKVNFYDLDIPLYNTTLDNIKFNISDKFIDGIILAKNKQSDVNIKLHALNKLTTPYIIKDFIIDSNKLNISDIITSISPAQSKTDISPKTEFNIKPDDIIIEKGSFQFTEVQYEKILSNNLKGNLNYKNNIINLNNISLNIAEGLIIANGNYNTKNTNLNLKASMNNCDSNILTNDFLKLPNQIFGKVDGTVELSGKKLHTFEGINSINSNINFSINNGKMPKLGSLEYLLRAGNLFKNGLTGLSINNIIEILTPYKTGEFEKITGNLTISNSEIQDLNIFSKGKNLSLYLNGNYNILDKYADIKIYGKLSQNISNALGVIGNASINQFIETVAQTKKNKNEKDKELQEKLNNIPNIENETIKPRYFKARVIGDINKDNYIKNFSWI